MRLHRACKLFVCLALLGISGACGGSKGSPTEPGPSGSAALTAPGGLGVSEVSVKDRAVTFTWNAVPGATSYVLEIGTSAGATNFAVITLEGGATVHRATDMPVGFSYARVRSKNAATTSPSGPDLRLVVPDLRDVIEALFFGTGPNGYASPGQNPPPSSSTQVFTSWAPGSNIPTRVGGLNDQEYRHVEQALQQIEEATLGSVRATIVERSSEPFAPNAFGARGELRIVVTTDMQTYCGDPSYAGCGVGGFSHPAGGFINNSTVAIRPGQEGHAFIHEMGHAVLRLKHIQWAPWATLEQTSWPGLPRPTMFPTAQPGPAILTPTEMDAIKMVYASGVGRSGFVSRSAFYGAGLIRNP